MKNFGSELSEWFLGLLLASMVIFVFAEIICRLFLERSLLWTEELARYLLLWTIYTGAVVAFRKGSHVRIDVVVSRLPTTWQKGIDYFVQILSLIFLIIVSIHGGRIVFLNLNLHSDILEIPMGFVYSIVPIAAIFISAFIIKLILSALGNVKRES